MNIVIGSDNHGYKIKPEIIKHLEDNGHKVTDVGAYTSESCDYPLYAKAAAEMVASKEADFGIVICSSGEGVMMVANKVRGVRCGLGYNDEVAALLRQHNDANMISFGATFMSVEDIIRRIDIFLSTAFEGGRHRRRINLFE